LRIQPSFGALSCKFQITGSARWCYRPHRLPMRFHLALMVCLTALSIRFSSAAKTCVKGPDCAKRAADPKFTHTRFLWPPTQRRKRSLSVDTRDRPPLANSTANPCGILLSLYRTRNAPSSGITARLSRLITLLIILRLNPFKTSTTQAAQAKCRGIWCPVYPAKIIRASNFEIGSKPQ